MKQLSKHNALQHAWIDGAEIQVFNKNAMWECDRKWVAIGQGHIWCEEHEYRIKPAEPEKPAREYPMTSMSNTELGQIWYNNNFVALANAAIRRAIDDGQVFTKEHLEAISVGFAMSEVSRVEEDRAQRDMAIAKAASKHTNYYGSPSQKEFEQIIAGVK